MSRRIHFPGPMGSKSYSLLQPDLYFRSGLDAQYGFPESQLIKLSAPSGAGVEFVITNRESYLPGYERLPDDQALEMCRRLNTIKKADTGEPLKNNHLFYHVTAGPQFTTHHPYRINSIQDPVSSAELDAVVSVDVNLQFHEDDKHGWELTLTAQGSRNFIVLDPNRKTPDFAGLSSADKSRSEKAEQAQLQLQLAYAFNAIESGKLKFSFSLLFQLVAGANIQYDPSMKKVALTWGKGGAAGFGLDIEHSSIKGVKLTIQGTVGSSASGNQFFDFGGPTFDPGIFVGLKFERQLF